MTEFFLRYVTHERRASYEALGWTCVGDGARMGSHGLWSCLMKWLGDGEPVEPSKTQTEHFPAHSQSREDDIR